MAELTEAELLENIEAFRKGQKVFVSEMYHVAIDEVCDLAREGLAARKAKQEAETPRGAQAAFLRAQDHAARVILGDPSKGISLEADRARPPPPHPRTARPLQ